ncbi:uncharacterized protein LOC129577457 isoform X26 [Sitodiplosis mosellana]|uniref:uncharacterized protein LOC129577457 isoform X26 n=1 Tax=Sitodiplosis mosellana TaxID=263140 RepID=UPI0024450B93|nr:uncharacterized protein LOC129577457 isoform X26 [Sitodiplosis mosellana]
MNISSFLKLFAALVCILLAFVSLPATVECAKKASGPSAPEVHEPVIEEVTQKQLERILQEKDYVAVYWYARSCLTCDKVLAELEKIDDDTDSFGVDFVKINDKRLAKQYGIKNFPALTYFREKEPIIYDGDLMDEEGVLDFLTSLEAMDLPDRIEEVNAKILAKIIEETDYVAVLFYDKDQKKSQKVLNELENIDDECDQNDIAFVKIDDDKEAEEWGIDEIPTIVFYERGIPHIYEGDLMKEEDLLGWLIHQKRHSEIPEVTDEMKDKLVESTKHLAVIFYDKDDKQDMRVLNELENIDDELEKEGIVIVRIDNADEAKEYGLDHLPALVYFEDKIPALYEGDLMNEDEVLEWLIVQKETATIEEVTDEILKDLIEDHEYVVAYFTGPCEEGDRCDDILDDLENIDDELDEAGIIFVTTEDTVTAKKLNIKTFPQLVFFRNRDPLFYKGDLEDEDEVLSWLTDENTLEIPGKIEEVNSKMLEKILGENDHVVVFFYREGDKKAQKILNELENIDDECEEKNIDFVKTSDEGIDKEYDLAELPALAFYRNKFRTIYSGDLMKEDEILEWVLDLYESNPDVIESVDRKTLQVLINDVEHLAVFFYDDKCASCPSILEELETIDDDTDEHGIQFVKSNDVKLAHEIGIFAFPALVYYETGVPIMYDGNLKNEKRVLQWLINQKNDECFYVGMAHQAQSARKGNNYVPNDYRPFQCCPTKLERQTRVPKMSAQKLSHQKDSDDKSRKSQFEFNDAKSSSSSSSSKSASGSSSRKSDGKSKAANESKYSSSSSSKKSSNSKKSKQNNDDDDDIVVPVKELKKAAPKGKDTNKAKPDDPEDPDARRILRHIELIDDEASEYGITIVKTTDKLMAKKYGYRKLPGLTYFRKGKNINYDGDIDDEEEILDWLTLPDNMEMTDHIERVNRKMFQKIRQTSDYLAVFLYSDDCKQCPRVLAEIEHIDDEADGAGINFVKIDDKSMAKEFGVFALPAILFFRQHSKEPVIYAGDLYEEDQILNWLMTQKDPGGDVIEDLEGQRLIDLIAESGSMAVYFYTDDCEQCTKTLEELENIDDDCDRHGITFVKTKDFSVAEQFGVHDFPALVYFESSIPNVFEGQLNEEEEVLQWLITQKTEDRIELITRQMLETMVEDTQYLAVYFSPERFQNQPSYCRSLCSPLPKKLKIKDSQNPLLLEYLERKKQIVEKQDKINCNICDQILEGLELIDDECDVFGIHMVKIQDPQLAKRYSIKTFPALVYFRNGNPLLFEGDMQNEQSVLEWLIDDDNRELADEIEEVNDRMLERLLDESSLLVVFFYEEDCAECEEILEELEQIDGEADMFGIDFVKIASHEAAQKYEVSSIPALVYFRKQVPMLYDGDLHQHDRILTWLTSQDVFEIKNEIEEVNRKMLDKLLEENEFLAVYFYEADHPDSTLVLEKLENIDSETDNLDITFVKMSDSRYARKWGVTKLPAIVYFRKRFPSIYRGDLLSEDEVLEWLRKNRFRQPELNIFMYALIAISVAFVLYTAFLLQCFKPPPSPAPSVHVKQQ